MISRYRHTALAWWVSAVVMTLAGLCMAAVAVLEALDTHFATAALYACATAGDAWTAGYAARRALRYRKA